VAAVSARGTTAGNEFFAAKSHGAVAAVAGLDTDSCFINEHVNLAESSRDPQSFSVTNWGLQPVFVPELWKNRAH
jgi:hypothetical protein